MNPKIGDFSAVAGQPLNIGLPAWASMHGEAGGPILIEVRLADGRPLPPWLSFDPLAGTITGRSPAQTNETLHIEVIARDSRGGQSSAFIELEVKPAPAPLQKGRASLAEQFARRELAGLQLQAALRQYQASAHRTH